MKNNKSIAVAVAAVASVALAIAAAVVYVIAFSKYYDMEIHHFASNCALASVFPVLFALSAAAAVTIPVFLYRRGTLKDSAPNQAEAFILWFISFLFIALALLSMTSAQPGTVENEASSTGFLSGLKTMYKTAFTRAPGVPMNFGAICTFLTLPLALLSAVPFIFSVSEKFRGSALHGAFTFAPILWGAGLLFKYYFDLTEMPLNDPELALTLVCISSVMIFFISESRNALGINSPAISAFASVITISLGGCTAVARIVLNLTKGTAIPPVMENIIFLSVSVLAILRLFTLRDRITATNEPAVSDSTDENN